MKIKVIKGGVKRAPIYYALIKISTRHGYSECYYRLKSRTKEKAQKEAIKRVDKLNKSKDGLNLLAFYELLQVSDYED